MKKHKYIILISLFIFAICLNTVVHFCHPSYKYYKENIDKLKSQFIAFKDSVVLEIVPSINTVNTNLTYNILTRYESNLIFRLNENFKNQNFQNYENKKENISIIADSQIKEIYVDDYHYSELNHIKYVRLYGDHYKIGDILLGEVIVSIDPLITRTLHYHFLNKKVSQKVQ